MLFIGLGVLDAGFSLFCRVADDVVFDIDMPRPEAHVLFIGQFDGSFIAFPYHDGVALQLWHHELLHLAQEKHFLHDIG